MTDTADTKAVPLGKVGDYTLDIHSSVYALEDDWRRLQKLDTSCLYQSYDWVRIALETFDTAHEPCIISGSSKNGVEFILPMVVEKTGITKTIRWIGDNHANICSGLFSRNFLGSVTRDETQQILEQINKHFSGLIILHLKNQLPELGGFKNPLFNLPNQPSVNGMFNVEIADGIDSVIERGNAKRKRKLFRRQVRIAEENGGYELWVPQTPEEIDASIDDFLHQKHLRLKQLGVSDVFGSKNAQSFLRTLAHQPMKDGVQPLRIFELKIGGKTRAMYGAGVLGDTCQCCINSVTYDELADISPGEMILYLMIEQLSKTGFKTLDLGVGSERYKFSWCQEHIDMFDTIMPLSVLAAPSVYLFKAKLLAKGYIRKNHALWGKIRKIRQAVAKVKG